MKSYSQFIAESAEHHDALKDPAQNPYHKILTAHGFQHSSTRHAVNPYASTKGPKPVDADYTVHDYTHPSHGKSRVSINQHHTNTGMGKSEKMNTWTHWHEQKNGIMAPSTGDTKPQLQKELTGSYGAK